MPGRAFNNENYAVERASWRSAIHRVDWRAVTVTAAAHIALFATLLSSITTAAAPEANARNAGISVFSLAQEPASLATQTAEAVIVPPPVVRVKFTSLLATVEPQFRPSAAVAQPQGQPCDIASLVGTALTTSEEGLSSIIAIDAAGPPISRATMLWDGAWVAPASLLDTTPFSIVQQSVVQAISAAPLDCQAQLITGPQFIMLDGVNNGRTIVLVMGSGSWSWDQLLPVAEPQGFEGIWSSLSTDKTEDNRPTA